MADHPNKHIRAAIEYANSNGWTLRKVGARAHFGDDCIAHNEIAMDARRRFIRRREMRKITRKIFAGPLIDVHTNPSSPVSEVTQDEKV